MTNRNKRCHWAGNEQIYIDYHDKEWGIPLYDEHKLFEFLILEGAQAGLSWITILKKREGYRKAFKDFDPEIVAKFPKRKVESLMKNEEIVRNRRKIESTIQNAKAFLKIQNEFGSFRKYIWEFVDGKPIQNNRKSLKEIPSSTELSKAISKDLKKRGFNFVGPTIVYAFMQATGMVNDHVKECHCYSKVKKLGVKKRI